jgi:hypothetical protein
MTEAEPRVDTSNPPRQIFMPPGWESGDGTIAVDSRAELDDIEYVLRDPAVLAELPEVQAMLREERNKALREAAIMVDDVATALRHSGMHVENSDLPACARRIRALIQEAPHE